MTDKAAASLPLYERVPGETDSPAPALAGSPADLFRPAEGRASLARKKAQVMASISRVAQSGKHQSQGWRYATDADYLDAIRPAMAEAGLALTMDMLSCTLTEHGSTQKGAKRYRCRVEVQIGLTCADTGTFETVQWIGEGIDEEDKGIPKALTQAEKYYLAKTFLMSSGDDVEAPSAERHPNAPRPAQQRKPAGGPMREKLQSALEAAGLAGDLDEADEVVFAILQREVDDASSLSAADMSRVTAVLNEAVKVAEDEAHDFLMDAATNGVSIATKTAVTKAWHQYQPTEA